MSKFKLAFAIHNHQPVGNFDFVFEDAHKRAYLPFLKLVEKHKNFRMSLHQSGILWDWQKKNHPEYFDLVRKMTDRGQIEILTGGFYEPILPSIPNRDILGQIELLSKYVHKNFKSKPTGLWLTERVWEPQLPEVLSQSGVQYVPVDDAHFVYAGFEQSQLNEPYITESNGYTVTLLPIQKRLRYLIPFGTIEELFSELKKQAEINPSGLTIYADDGEKFGVWPDTYKHCYEDGWLDSFFDELEKNNDWLEVIPLNEAATRKPVGRAYLPTASYSEMLHWALPEKANVEYEDFEKWLKDEKKFEKYGRFVRGGHWRNFLSKYEESNLMHKKMLYLSNRLNSYIEKHPKSAKKSDAIKKSLYAAQCNCPYWHGVFGGLYLPHIRQAVYANLVEAENELNKLEKTSGFNSSKFDYDADGFDEVLVSTDSMSAVFKPDRGGTLLDLSLLKHSFSPTDTLSRRREGYHRKLLESNPNESAHHAASIHDAVKSKEAHLENFLVNDWYLKRCFIDHFTGNNFSLIDFQKGKFKEDGDFILEPYTVKINKTAGEILMSREGNIWRSGGNRKIKVSKRFKFIKNSESIDIEYQIESMDNKSQKMLFAVENNCNFQAGHADDRYILIDGKRNKNSYLDSVGEYLIATRFAMVDEYRKLAFGLKSDKDSRIWHLPIFTVSLSEGGLEKVYQGTTFMNLFELELSANPVSINFTLFAGGLKNLPPDFSK